MTPLVCICICLLSGQQSIYQPHCIEVFITNVLYKCDFANYTAGMGSSTCVLKYNYCTCTCHFAESVLGLDRQSTWTCLVLSQVLFHLYRADAHGHNCILNHLGNSLGDLMPDAHIISDLLWNSLSGVTISPDMLITSDRPDLVIYHPHAKQIHIIELTVPFETDIKKHHLFKCNKLPHMRNWSKI